MSLRGIHKRKKNRLFHKDLVNSLGMRDQSATRSQQKAYCRVWDETGVLDLEEKTGKDLQ